MDTVVKAVIQTQRVIVEPGGSSVAVILAGPQGPAGTGGGGPTTGNGIPSDLPPVRLSAPMVVNGRYNWNSGNNLFSNDDWQACAYLSAASLTQVNAWRRPVGNYNFADREEVDLTAVPGSPFGTFENDSHNQIIVAVDRNDNVIVIGNHHNDPLNMVVWDASQAGADFTDPDQWEVYTNMVVPGDEDQVTYFTFHYDHIRDRLILHHSCGVGAGNSSRFLNLWDPDDLTWSRICHFLDGESTSPTQTAYPEWAIRESDGMICAFFTWHTWGQGSDTDHDLCYAQSPDGGVTWERIDGTNYTLPIRFDTGDNHEAEVIYPIANGSSFCHGGGACFDADGNPWYIQRDTGQRLFVIRWNGTAWVKSTLPTEYSTIYQPVGSLFCHDERIYATFGMRSNGREQDLIFVDVTDPERPEEFLVANGLATPGTGLHPDPEAFRRRGLWERVIGQTTSSGEEFGHVQVPNMVISVDLNYLPVLRSGIGAVGLEMLYQEMSNFQDTWTVAGTGMTLLEGAPSYSLYPQGDMRQAMVFARLHVWGTIASSSTMRVGLRAGYAPDPDAVIDVDVCSGYIGPDGSEYTQTGWNVIPAIPFGGTLFPYHVACAAAVSGSDTGTIKKLLLEVAFIPGMRYNATE